MAAGPAPQPEAVDVRPLVAGDLDRVAQLHQTELPHGLFPQLGRRFLRRYHATFVASPHAVAVATPREGQPAGFLVGTTDQRAHHRWLARHHALGLALEGLAGLLTHPRALSLFLRTRLGRYGRALLRAVGPRRVQADAPAPSHDGPVAVLMHVAVDPARRSGGMGRRLTQELVDRAGEAGAREVRLVTRTSDGAGAFYERLGWTASTSRTTDDGATVVEYRLPVAGDR